MGIINKDGNVESVTFYNLIGARRAVRRVMTQEIIKNARNAYRDYIRLNPDMTPVDIADAIVHDKRNAAFFENESECYRILDAHPKVKESLLKRGNYLWNTLMIAILFSFDKMYSDIYNITFEPAGNPQGKA